MISKRQSVLNQWCEQLEKAKKRLAESEECYRRFGDEDTLKWVEEDKAKVAEIEKNISEVIEYMDEHNIQ